MRREKNTSSRYRASDFDSIKSSFERGNRNFGPREMHKAKCSDCGCECEVPFKPSGDKPVYCRNCFAKHRPRRF